MGSSCVIVALIENYSTSKPLKGSPEKSQILSCDTVVANEQYVMFTYTAALYSHTVMLYINFNQVTCLTLRLLQGIFCCLTETYRVIQEEFAILWEMIVCVILSKKVHMNMGPILNGYRDML